jgi:hypothetical protein
VTASQEIRDLAAAIRAALDVPAPVNPGDWGRCHRLVLMRAAAVRRTLSALLDDQGTVETAVEVLATGREYGEGVLRGALLALDDKKGFRDHVLVSG